MSGGHGHIEGSNKRIAVLIAILAALLAIAEMGAKSSQTES
jgi:alpha-D-ribose 1-methylphosphonate 5-triphosphate synthase subunit PhnG